MSNPYIAQDVLDHCREARRNGRTLEHLAGQVGCDPAHLARLLGVPVLKPVPNHDVPEFDLWAIERLQAQL